MSFILSLILALGTVVSDAGAPDAVDRLANAVANRLLLMEEVARYKWTAGLPVLDAAREAELLEAALADAAALGLDAAWARDVVQAQMAASRAFQRALFDAWERTRPAPFEYTPDLATELRPAIAAATHDVLRAARDAQAALRACAASARLDAAPAAVASRVAAVWPIAIDGFFSEETCTP